MKQRSWMVVRLMGRRHHNHRMMMMMSSSSSTHSDDCPSFPLSLDSYHNHPMTATKRQPSSSLVTTTTTSSAVAFGRPGQRRQRQSLSFSSSSTTYYYDDPNSTTTPTSNHPPHDYDYSNRHDVLRTDTQQFLDPQTVLDTTDAELWKRADAILRGWLSSFDLDLQQEQHVDITIASPLERVQVCLRILDRLAALLPQGEFLWVSSLLDRDILVQLLLSWKHGLQMDDEERRIISQHHDDNNNDNCNKEAQQAQAQASRLRRLLTPSFLAAKLDQYRYASLIQPDASIFHILLETAACRRYFSYRHGIGFAHGLLLKLVQVTATSSAADMSHDDDDHDHPTPPLLMDVVSVAIVMKGWIQHGQPHKAEEWLDRIESWQTQNTATTSATTSSSPLAQVRPNKILYTTVLAGWAQQGHAERAMNILHRQLEVYQTSGNSDCRPDTQTWNTVLGALAKSKHHTNNGNGNWVVTQAQQLVEELMPAYDCAPDDHTWTSLMSCYVKHKPSEAKKLLKQLETKHYRHHHDDDHNNTTTTTEIKVVPLPVYNAMLHMYAHHGNVQSAISLLERMEAAASEATAAAAPDEISYNTVLAAYCKLKDPTAALQAEAFWDRHADKFAPSIVTYGTLLECWSQHAKHSPKTAMDRMTAILHEMKEPAQGAPLSTAKTITPNTTCYNIILKTWAQLAGLPRNNGVGGRQHQQDPSERVSSDYCLERVLELFEEMANSSNGNIRPDDTTFRTILHAVIGSSSSRPKRQVILDYILPKMKRLGFHPKGKKDEELLRRCLKASSPIRSSPPR